MNRLLVIGGTGFVGRRICRTAVVAGYEVQSISRRGQPSGASIEGPDYFFGEASHSYFQDSTDSWVDHVEWIEADLFDPADWRDHLTGCDAVIHSIGITSETPSEGVTFERLNGDSAILTALEAERAGIDSFVFISASEKPPGLSERYLTAKRRAERGIENLNLRVVVLRPGPIYGTGNPHFSSVVSRILELADRYKWLTTRLGPARPLSVDAVAASAFQAATDTSTEAVLDIPTIQATQTES